MKTRAATLPKQKTCTRCGLLGHRQMNCTRPTEYRSILGIGVEVEGWWRDRPGEGPEEAETARQVFRRATAAGWRVEDDCSLHYLPGYTSKELTTTGGVSLAEACNFVRAHWPHARDDSAGMHIHISVRPDQLPWLMTEEFLCRRFPAIWEEFGRRENIPASHPFWGRLKGIHGSSTRSDPDYFCRAWKPEEVRSTSLEDCGTRYRALNFKSLERHGTVELRLLPLFRDADMAIKAVQYWIESVQDYLWSQRHLDFGTLDWGLATDRDVLEDSHVEVTSDPGMVETTHGDVVAPVAPVAPEGWTVVPRPVARDYFSRLAAALGGSEPVVEMPAWPGA